MAVRRSPKLSTAEDTEVAEELFRETLDSASFASSAVERFPLPAGNREQLVVDVIDLQRRVRDAEALLQHLLERPADGVTVGI